MIDENKTHQKKGYYASELKPKSCKMVCRVCEVCGLEQWIRYSSRHDKCHSCARKGIVFSDEHKYNLSKSHIGHIGYWTGKTRSEKSKNKMSKAKVGMKQSDEHISNRIQIGKDHYNWQGGITQLTRRRTRGMFWKRMADNIRKRDNNTCQICGFTDNNIKLPVHHIIPFNTSQDNNKENLITLCQSCHIKEESKLR